ncbi:MAG TPA: hypothetical protein VL688_11850 [Verrucomicrobiae bacterium]|jgi:hypothetical protein|nr:hypothetical protein [Verrucomicrobiae bacterium]
MFFKRSRCFKREYKAAFRAAWLFVLMTASVFPVALAENVQYHSEGRRDPFIPLVGPHGIITRQPKAAAFQIEGIIIDPQGGSMVLINGDVYHAGDKIGEATLLQIFKDRIILAQEDEEKTIWLREEITGQPGEAKNDIKSPQKK